MHSFFGKTNLEGNRINPEEVRVSLKVLSFGKNLKNDVFSLDTTALGAVQHFSSGHQENMIEEDEKNKLALVGDFRIDNREELFKQLDCKDEAITDGGLLVLSYLQWGEECPKYLLGDFAFAIWDGQREQLFCARDHFGVKSFNYYSDEQQFIFSSDVPGITAQKSIQLSIDEQYLADLLSIVKSDHHRTTYHEIKKLPPAHTLVLQSGKIKINRYRQLQPANVSFQSEKEYMDRFKELVVKAVERRISPELKIGAELSGGLDSSSIAAIASRSIPIATYSHVLPENQGNRNFFFQDERMFIESVTNYCNIKKSYLVTSEKGGFLNALHDSVDLNDGLIQQNFSEFSDQLYKAASKNTLQVLLSGFGGDEAVTRQAGGYLNELIHNGQYKEVKEDLISQGISKPKAYFLLLKKIIKKQFPGIIKLYWRKKEAPWWVHKYNNLPLSETFINEKNITERYFEYYESIIRETLEEKVIERTTHPHVAQRMEYCSLAAKAHGIEYRYPFFDKELVEFYLAMPLRLKARNGIRRYAIREVMKGYLPEEIRMRMDKTGATIPTVYMRALKDKEKVYELYARASKNEVLKKFIDMDRFKTWIDNYYDRSEKNKYLNPGAFHNYLKFILFVEKHPSLFE